MKFRIWKIEVIFSNYKGSLAYDFGVTYTPRFGQFELNFGKYAITFWYRGDNQVHNVDLREAFEND